MLQRTLISNIQKRDHGKNENLNTDDDTFSLTKLHKVTIIELLLLLKHVYHRVMFSKLNGFEWGYNGLDNAGLIRTN